MTKNYEHYISRSIQSLYWRKMIAPFFYLILLGVLWFLFPFSDLLFPTKITEYPQIGASLKTGNQYIETDLTDLYFTGYTNTQLGQTIGYYYYTAAEDSCMFVLLSPRTCEEGLPFISNVHIRARIMQKGKAFQQLTDALSQDLSWTPQGLRGKVSPYVLNEPEYLPPVNLFLLAAFFATGLYACAAIIVSIAYILFPVLSPPCRQLGRFGKPSELLAQAEDELATLPQLATEDMFITEHYFIEIAHSGIAVVPIQEMIWIYKYSTLHKIFWYHFNISYTLHITANKHLYLQCPKNIKSDIDGIIDYLAEANHNILVGFSEENRLKVRNMQDPAGRFSKWFLARERKEDDKC